MFWVQTDEPKYYKDRELLKTELINRGIYDRLGIVYGDIEWVILPSSIIDIRDALLRRNGQVVVVSPLYPSDFGYKDYGFFTLIELPNEFGVLNSEQKGIVDDDAIVSANLGLKVTKSNVTFADMAGARKLLEDTEMMIRLEALNRAIGGLFLFGVPGTGKSYFAECFAGQTNRHLVEMDLSFIINTNNPTRTIDKIFDFLYQHDDMRFVLWIDEIEKMYDMQNLKAKQVFGKLLTKLNEVAKNEVQSIVFIATANKIADIMKNNPEFLRKGRFRKLYFLDFPKMDDATDIIDFYIKRAKKKFSKELLFSMQMSLEDAGIYEGYARKGIPIFKDLMDFISLPQNRAWLLNNMERKNEAIENNEFVELVDKYSISVPASNILGEIDVYYHDSKVVKSRFIFTPSEIKTFVDEVMDITKLNGNSEESIKQAMKETIPLQLSMKTAILAMRSQAQQGDGVDFQIFTKV